MALLITDECISCGACLPECPNEGDFRNSQATRKRRAIMSATARESAIVLIITHDRCTECVGHFDEPQCAAVCPVDNCCIADPLYPETTEALLEKVTALNPDKTIDPTKIWSGVRN
ncbi:ferredoxin-like protein in nif region [Nitrospirota bacterium]|nr:ferredoxin-like protein in nif region [Nitrospirota bacterium]